VEKIKTGEILAAKIVSANTCANLKQAFCCLLFLNHFITNLLMCLSYIGKSYKVLKARYVVLGEQAHSQVERKKYFTEFLFK